MCSVKGCAGEDVCASPLGLSGYCSMFQLLVQCDDDLQSSYAMSGQRCHMLLITDIAT